MALDFPNTPTDGQTFSSSTTTWKYSSATGTWSMVNTAAAFNQTIVSKTANYTAIISDANLFIEMNVATANTFTVPPNSSVAFDIGTMLNVVQTGAGQTTLTPGAGVTINGTPGLKTRAQWSAATLIKRGTDTWLAIGDLSA